MTRVRLQRRVASFLVMSAAVPGLGSACAPDAPPAALARLAGYSTMHDTLPEAIHQAKHRATERAAAEIMRSRSAEATLPRLTRIAGSRDAWLDFTLRRRPDGPLAARPDTVTLLMNCNADSLVVRGPDARALRQAIVLLPGDALTFADGGVRIRVYGLRPMGAGQRSETLVRMAQGGDLVLRTPLEGD